MQQCPNLFGTVKRHPMLTDLKDKKVITSMVLQKRHTYCSHILLSYMILQGCKYQGSLKVVTVCLSGMLLDIGNMLLAGLRELDLFTEGWMASIWDL